MDLVGAALHLGEPPHLHLEVGGVVDDVIVGMPHPGLSHLHD